MGSRAFRAQCDMCGCTRAVTHLSRSRYEPQLGNGPVMDQGTLCLQCWRDLPQYVPTHYGKYVLVARAY